jgi:hypothetical protein
MEQYDDTFESSEATPSIKQIEKRLRKLGCTKDRQPSSRPGDQEPSSTRGTQAQQESPPSNRLALEALRISWVIRSWSRGCANDSLPVSFCSVRFCLSGEP